MSFNLLDSVKTLFTNELIGKAAATLGESETGIQNALRGTIPSVLMGLLGKAGTSTDGAAGILNMAKETAGSGILSNISGLLGGNSSGLAGKGADMLKGLLGDKAGGIANLISGFSGVKSSTASSLLSMAAPLALGVLGRHATSNNLSAGGLMSFLDSQKSSIMNALPAGLSSVAGMLGLGSTKQSTGTTTHYSKSNEKSGSERKFILPLFLGILLVGLAIYFFKGCGNNQKTEAVVTDTTNVNHQDPIAAEPVTPAVASFKVKLPDGTELDANKGGIEDQLVTFLGTDYMKLGADSLKKIWFDFDNLNFKTGSAELTPESQKQVDNIAAILKAFPAVKLKIGGYTDKTGNEVANKKLSDQRAKAVKAALDKTAVASQITGAEGYGSALAKYPADAPESDRVKDRHVSVSVRL
jgi:outer membrane protein OmpA-like peptidoglycan-associated protein